MCDNPSGNNPEVRHAPSLPLNKLVEARLVGFLDYDALPPCIVEVKASFTAKVDGAPFSIEVFNFLFVDEGASASYPRICRRELEFGRSIGTMNYLPEVFSLEDMTGKVWMITIILNWKIKLCPDITMNTGDLHAIHCTYDEI
nr:hypothetical protein Iba_chr14fCG7260 [Ipomoea batatas]